MDQTRAVVGFDTRAVEEWLATVTRIVPPIRWTALSGGHSNLTYLLSDAGGREVIVRRPPQGELLPKAHDMWREYRVIEALRLTDVPVAQPIAYCDDRAVADTHFYAMGKLDGRALASGATSRAWMTSPARATAGRSFIEVLGALHRIDPADVGLEDLGRHDGYVDRQLHTWHESWVSSCNAAAFDDSRAHELHALLAAKVPPQGSARIVHGDYGPHNCMFSRGGGLVGVVDWELATLGDPIADFASSLNAWAEPGDEGVYGADPPTAVGGFSSRLELAERYSEVTGADLAHLDYYRVLSSWRTACILNGVVARYRSGQKSAEQVDVAVLLSRVDAALTLSTNLARGLA